jgi:ABC-type sugar transport system substrate-binding protein
MTAPFALHPSDAKRAREYLKKAKAAGITVSEAVEHARAYLANAQGFPTDESKQLAAVRKYFTGKLPD